MTSDTDAAAGGGEDKPGTDRDRTVDLLWGDRERPRRGPKPRLDVDRVVAAAIAVADAEGLEAVTMQRTARELGYTTMSLYRYVSSKDQLIELMCDAALGAAPAPPAEAAGWRDELRAWVRELYLSGLRRPWVLHAPMHRPPRGPRQLTWLEAAARPLRAAGLSATETMSMASFLSISVMGMVRAGADMQRANTAAGTTWRQAESDYEVVFRRAAADGGYPFITALLTEEEPPPVDGSPSDSSTGRWEEELGGIGSAMAFALERIIDGIEVHIATASGRR